MGALSRAVLILAVFAAGYAWAQVPDTLIGTDDTGYAEFPPSVAVIAGLPGQAGNADMCLTTNGTILAWGACDGEAAPYASAILAVGSANAAGSANTIARGDHVHAGVELTSAAAVLPAATGAPGNGTTAARWNHVHPSELLPIGAANTCFRVNAAGTSIGWRACPSGGASLSNETPQPPGTAAAGDGTAASRDDHVHALQAVPQPSTSTPAGESGGGAVGVATTFARGDHVHPAGGGGVTVPPYATDISPTGTANAAGSADTIARGDHVHSAPQLSSATPEDVGTAAAGSSERASRADHVHGGGGGGGTVPPFGSVIRSTGTANHAGVQSSIARTDHVHSAPQLSNSTPQGPSTSPTHGASLEASRADHRHPEQDKELPSLTGNANALLRVNVGANGVAWVEEHEAVLAGLPAIAGQAGKVLTVNSGASGVEWTDKGGGSGGGGPAAWVTELDLSPPTVASGRILQNLTAGQVTSLRSKITGTTPYEFRVIFEEANTRFGTGYSEYRLPELINIGTSAKVDLFGGGIVAVASASTDEIWYTQLRLDVTTGIFVVWASSECENGCAVTTGDVSSVRLQSRALSGGSNGGGSTGPSIPSPTGTGNFLRVDSAGTAYELQSGFGSVLPQPNGAAALGVATNASREDHVHETDPEVGEAIGRLVAKVTNIQDEDVTDWVTVTDPDRGGWVGHNTHICSDRHDSTPCGPSFVQAASVLSYANTPIDTTAGDNIAAIYFRIPLQRDVQYRTISNVGPWLIGQLTSGWVVNWEHLGNDDVWDYWQVSPLSRTITGIALQRGGRRHLWTGDLTKAAIQRALNSRVEIFEQVTPGALCDFTTDSQRGCHGTIATADFNLRANQANAATAFRKFEMYCGFGNADQAVDWRMITVAGTPLGAASATHALNWYSEGWASSGAGQNRATIGINSGATDAFFFLHCDSGGSQHGLVRVFGIR